MDYPQLSLPELLEQSAAAKGNAPLIDFMGRKFSYAEVQDAATRVGEGLRKLGVRKGDRVGLYLPNTPHYVAAYYGALRIGAIVVNVSPLYSVDELCHTVEDSGLRVLFTVSASALLPNALAVLERTKIEKLVVGSVAGALPRAKSILYRLFRRKEVVHDVDARPAPEDVQAAIRTALRLPPVMPAAPR